MLKQEKPTSPPCKAVAEEVKRTLTCSGDTRHPRCSGSSLLSNVSQVGVGDKRVRLAVNYALNRQAISEARPELCPPAGVIVPRLMDLPCRLSCFPAIHRRQQLLAEAGYPRFRRRGTGADSPL
jgi:hypothetical protein